MVTLLASPNGLPNASTTCPAASESESPSLAKGRSVSPTFSMARSVSWSVPQPVSPAAPAIPAGAPNGRAPGHGGTGDDDHEAPAALDHVRVGDDESVPAQDHARPGAALGADERVGSGSSAAHRSIGGDLDLHHGGRDWETTPSSEWLRAPRSARRGVVWAAPATDPRRASPRGPAQVNSLIRGFAVVGASNVRAEISPR